MLRNDVQVLVTAVKTVGALFYRRWKAAAFGFALCWVFLHMPESTWLGSHAASLFRRRELVLSQVGWTMLFTLAVIAVLQIAEGFARRKGGFNRGHVVHGGR